MSTPPPVHAHAIVPLKNLTHAKSRLSACLSPAERRSLVLSMLDSVLGVLCAACSLEGESGALQAVWVVGSDAPVLEIARQHGAQPLYDEARDLNMALSLAKYRVRQAGADALLIVPADIPLITPGDVTGLVAALRPPAEPARPVCVIAPNQEASGTNALGLTLPTAMPFLFGASSFQRHLQAAHVLGLHALVYRSPTLALDVDRPDDLARARKQICLHRSERDDNYWLCCGT